MCTHTHTNTPKCHEVDMRTLSHITYSSAKCTHSWRELWSAPTHKFNWFEPFFLLFDSAPFNDLTECARTHTHTKTHACLPPDPTDSHTILHDWLIFSDHAVNNQQITGILFISWRAEWPGDRYVDFNQAFCLRRTLLHLFKLKVHRNEHLFAWRTVAPILGINTELNSVTQSTFLTKDVIWPFIFEKPRIAHDIKSEKTTFV